MITTGYNLSKCTPTPHRRLQGYFAADAENISILQAHLKKLLNDKAPHLQADTFTHINILLYKHAMDTTQEFFLVSHPQIMVFHSTHQSPQ